MPWQGVRTSSKPFVIAWSRSALSRRNSDCSRHIRLVVWYVCAESFATFLLLGADTKQRESVFEVVVRRLRHIKMHADSYRIIINGHESIQLLKIQWGYAHAGPLSTAHAFEKNRAEHTGFVVHRFLYISRARAHASCPSPRPSTAHCRAGRT